MPTNQKKGSNMKAMSEFPAHLLLKGLELKKNLMTEGKTEEEIMTSLTEALKLKENRVKYFSAALGIAEANTDKLYRIRVLSFEEGETVPEKATKVEEVYYLPEFFAQNVVAAKPVTVKAGPAGRGGGKKDRPRGPKASPWGLSPEEIAAKKEASLRAAAAKTK
jgi:hypothetical protein